MTDKKIITLDSLVDKIEPFKESIFNKPFTSDKPSLPWRIPSSSICEEWEKVNLILKKSMEIQSSKIPDTHPLTRFILSNACFIVSGLLQHYLKSLKFCEDAKVVYGVLLWPDEIKEGVNYDGNDFEYLLSLGMAEPDLPLAPPIMLDQSITIPNRGADYAPTSQSLHQKIPCGYISDSV